MLHCANQLNQTSDLSQFADLGCFSQFKSLLK